MDIKQIITDNLPEGVVITDKSFNAIVKDINKAVGTEYVPKEWLSKKADEWDAEKRELKDKIAQQSDYDSLKSKLETEIAAHKATRDDHAAEKNTAETLSLLTDALKNKNANPKAINLLLKAIDMSKVEKDNSTIKNIDDVLKPVIDQYGDFFGKTETRGVNIGGETKIDNKTTSCDMNSFILAASGKQ